MQIHTIETRTHGRYLVDRPDGDGPFPILVGFHGYAESAERMLEELARVRGERQWLLVSVQALNRFYNRTNDRVIANWMTRQDRELAIADNMAYITAVVAAVRRDQPTTDTLVYGGFSQGVATAYRAAAFVHERRLEGGPAVPPASGAILLAGDIPPDVAPLLGTLPPVLIGRGSDDDWYTPAKAAADLDLLWGAGITPAIHVFAGGHVWDASFVARAGAFLDTLSVP